MTISKNFDMTNAELIAKIKAEIERRKKALHCTLFNDEYNDLLSFLSTLEEQVCPEYCVRSHCIGCSKYNPDEWSNKPRKARVKATGEIVEGFTDGEGHFDVFTDHNVCNRYDVSAVEFDTIESEKPMNPEDAMKELNEKIALIKQRGTWDGVDVDKYMDEVRGREPEKPMSQEGLIEEVKRYYSDNFEYLSSDQPTLSILTNIARHFSKWGVEHAKIDVTDFCKPIDPSIAQCIADHSWEMLGEDEKPVPNDLEEAANHHICKTVDAVKRRGWELETQDITDAFIAGAKWDRSQMMKEAVEADVNIYRDLAAGKSWAEFVVEKPPKNLGDKVRIIIVKED
jgi:hypothetical protein